MADLTSLDEFVRNVEAAIDGVAPNSLGGDTDFRALDEWDSLAALSVLAMIDSEYESEVSGDELRRSKTIADLFAVVQSRK